MAPLPAQRGRRGRDLRASRRAPGTARRHPAPRLRVPAAHYDGPISDHAITIRRARRGDAETIGALVAEGLADKVRPAFGARGADAIATLVGRDVDRPLVRYLVAEIDGRVVGTSRLAIGQSADPTGLGPLAHRIGWLRSIRGAIVLGLLAHRRLDPDDAYLEELAVAPDVRRRGVGSALLAACHDESRRAGKGRVILWVAEHNRAAVALYGRCGYRVARRRRTLRGRLVFATPAILLMARDIRPERRPGPVARPA